MYNITDDAGEQPDVFPDQTGQAGKYLTTNGSDVSWGNAVDYKNLTDCILEMPQKFSLEINSNSNLVLKAGSKVYIPNGFESDGTTMKFDVVSLSTDAISANAYDFFFYSLSDGYLYSLPATNIYSGGTAPSAYDFMFWYDTTNNVIKYTNNHGSSWASGFSFPVCLGTSSNGTVVSSIDQVFNGIGYIGSTLFALPGIKFLIPDGLNTDGSLKTNLQTTSSVRIRTMEDTRTYQKVGIGLYAEGYAALWGLFIYGLRLGRDNRNYDIYSGSAYPTCNVCSCTLTNGRISNLVVKTPFHAVGYSDSSTITNWAMPSDRLVSLSVGASGTAYTAPANGFFFLRGNSSTASNVRCIVGLFRSVGSVYMGNYNSVYSGASVFGLYTFLPAKRRDEVHISYVNTTDLSLHFVYAEGETGEST